MLLALILLYFCTSGSSVGEYICLSTLGTCTFCYVFITLLFHASGLDRYFQSRPYKNKYVHEAFDNSNMRQECPELEIEMVDVAMCEEPHTNEDAPTVEEGIPNTRNEFAYMEEMKRTQCMCVDVRKMRKKFERSLAVSMRWIMRGWHLKTPTLETTHFQKQHATADICDSLLNARIESGLSSKRAKGRIPQSEGAMSSDPLAYLEAKPSLDAQVLMSDCGSDVSVESRKDNLLDSNRCAFPCLSIAVPAAIKNHAIGKFLGRLYSQSSVKAEQEIILCNWLMGQNDGGAPPEVVDWARRRLCGQASSATSGHAFSKAGLIINKKGQRLTADNVDDISVLGWHYKDNGCGESAKRPWCVPRVEGEILEEKSQMAA